MAGLGRLADSEMVAGLDVWYLKRSGFWEILGTWRDSGTRTKSFYGWWGMYFFVFFLPLTVVGVWGPFETNPDLEGFTLMILNPLAWAQTCVKFLILWIGINKQARVLDLMRKDFLTCVPSHKEDQANEILQTAAKFANRLTNLGIWADVATCSFWSILPILRSDFFNFTLGITWFGWTAPPDHNKLMGYWYPVDFDSNPWVQIIYVYEFLIIMMAGFMIAILEGLIIQLVTLYNAYSKVLIMLLEEMTEHNNSLKYDTLIDIVKEHERLMTYGADMQDLYNAMITFQMSSGLVILIITIFNFFLVSKHGAGLTLTDGFAVFVIASTKNVDLVIMLKMVIFLLYTLIEISAYCYVGQRMETTSQDVGFAAYSSEWYTQDIQFRKTIQMIMVRSMSPMTLRFGKMYPINFIALMSLLQCAYSTAMFMNNMTDEKALRESQA